VPAEKLSTSKPGRQAGSVFALILFAATSLLAFYVTTRGLGFQSKNAIVGVALGMLSSSCCMLQMALNLLSLGCAGFAALDRWQRPARAMTFALGLWRIAYVRRNFGIWWPLTVEGAAVCTLTLVLAMSPELVRFVNRKPWKRRTLSSIATIAVPDVKCEACASKLRSVVVEKVGTTASSISIRFSEPPSLSYVDVSPAEGVELDALVDRSIAACKTLGYKPTLTDG